MDQPPTTTTTVPAEGRVTVTATNSQGEMVLGGVRDRCARGGRAAVTATDSHGETVLGDVHGREHLPRPGRRWQMRTRCVLIHVPRYRRLLLNLHRLGPHGPMRLPRPGRRWQTHTAHVLIHVRRCSIILPPWG